MGVLLYHPKSWDKFCYNKLLGSVMLHETVNVGTFLLFTFSGSFSFGPMVQLGDQDSENKK